MKNFTSHLLAVLLVIFFVLGCGISEQIQKATGGGSNSSETSSSQDKSTSEKAVEEVIVEKTGVPECDELSSYISQLASSEDEGYVAKATREFIINRYREAIRKSVEENKENPEKLAKWCKEYKTQLETYKSKEESKKENQ